MVKKKKMLKKKISVGIQCELSVEKNNPKVKQKKNVSIQCEIGISTLLATLEKQRKNSKEQRENSNKKNTFGEILK